MDTDPNRAREERRRRIEHRRPPPRRTTASTGDPRVAAAPVPIALAGAALPRVQASGLNRGRTEA
jgi:hypothetical protein